jgi:hypothetical protein
MSEVIEENEIEITSESYEDPEIDSTERKKRITERGPEEKPRTYRVWTLVVHCMKF